MYCVLMLLPALASAELYKWVDEKGKVHYSDVAPKKDTKPVYLPPLPVTKSQPNAQQILKKKSARAVAGAAAYKTFKITSPTADQLFGVDQPDINVSIQLEPPLQRRFKHKLVILLDGNPVSEGLAMSTTLTGLARGTHTLTALIKDERGRTVATVLPVSFHVKRPHR